MQLPQTNPRWFKRGAPLVVRLHCLLLSITDKNGGQWVNLDLSRIIHCLKCSRRHLQRLLNQLRDRSQAEADYPIIFRSVNIVGGKGRRVMVCGRSWFDTHGEAFEACQEGGKRGLRRSFEQGEEPIEGSDYSKREQSAPNDIHKKRKDPKGSDFSQTSRQKLRAISFGLASSPDVDIWLDEFHRANAPRALVRNVIYHHLQSGYWRDDILNAVLHGLRLTHVAVADELPKSKAAYFIGLVKDRLRSHATKGKDYVYSKIRNYVQKCKAFLIEGMEVPRELARLTSKYAA